MPCLAFGEAEGSTVQQATPGRDRWAFWALALFCVVVYVAPGEWIEGTEKLRLALVSSALAAALLALRRLAHLEPFYFDGARGWALIGLLAVAVGSISWSVHSEVSRETAIGLAKLVAIYLTMVNVITTWKRLAVIAGLLIASSIVTSIGVIDWYRDGVDLVEGYRARWVGVYADPNHMAMDVGLVVPLALAFVVRRGTGLWWRAVCGVAAGLAVTAVVLSHSRGGFIGLSAGLAIWVFRERQWLQASALGVVLAIVLVAFAPASFWSRTRTVATFEEDVSAMGRVHAWEVAAQISHDRPLLGVGAGAFRYAWPLYAPPEARRAYVAHNVFLDVIGELGLIGFALFLVFSGGAAGGAFRSGSDPQWGWLGRAISASIAGYLVCDLFSGYLLSAHLYVLFGLGACADRVFTAQTARERPVRLALREANA